MIHRKLLLLLALLAILCGTAAAETPRAGTVVVWEGGNRASIVQRYTGSTKTHAAIVLYEGQTPYVYEAANPDVHRYTLAQYMGIIKADQQRSPSIKVHWLQPRQPYTPSQLAAMKRYADAQLGMAFSMRSYLQGRVYVTSTHCCEYVGNILAQSGRHTTLGPRETPKSIYEAASRL